MAQAEHVFDPAPSGDCWLPERKLLGVVGGVGRILGRS